MGRGGPWGPVNARLKAVRLLRLNDGTPAGGAALAARPGPGQAFTH